MPEEEQLEKFEMILWLGDGRCFNLGEFEAEDEDDALQQAKDYVIDNGYVENEDGTKSLNL